jgi:hypothetical protein
MTHERDIERLLDHWFTDGPAQAPDRVLDAVVDRIGHQRQRPTWRLDWRLPAMTPIIKFGAAAAAVGIVIIGFGLLRGPSTNVGGPTASPTPSTSLAPPSASAAAAVPRACDLVTTAEVDSALALTSTITSGTGDVDIDGLSHCSYRAAGAEVLQVSYRIRDGAPVFDVWSKTAGVQVVPALGDEAVWDPAQATLFILKGSRFVSISGGEGSAPITLDAAKLVGASLVKRM